MEDADPEFARQVRPGDIVVAGNNFGCGSSREHAPLAIKAAGISCVVAATFARIFYRNALNIGLPILECPARRGDKPERNWDQPGRRKINTTTGKVYQAAPFPKFMRELIAAGGLIPYVRSRLNC